MRRPLRLTLTLTGVLVLHALLLWLLQTGLLRQSTEVVVAAELLGEFIDARNPSQPKTATQPPEQTHPLPPQTAAPTPPAPSNTAPPEPSTPQPTAPGTTSTANAATNATATEATPQRLESPSSDAQYLQNPKPNYPPMSKRLGEQGTVVLRVLIGADGTPKKAEVLHSSGFERLDQAALKTVLRWRFVPGKRGGVAETMWYEVPIEFRLDPLPNT